MKTLKLLLTFVLILTCLLCAVSCEFLTSLGIGEHVHEYGTEWNYDDNNHWKLCSDNECNAETEKAAHTWGEPTVTEAQVGKEGSRVYTCTVCSATKKEIIPALEHTHIVSKEWISDKNEHWNSCEGCDAHLNKTAHVWDDGTVIVEATSGNKGTIRYRCVVCDRTKTEDIPALPAKMSEAEWKNLFIFDNVRVDLWFDVAGITSSEGVLLIDGEYAEITSDGEAQITPTEQQISDFDFSNCYDAFNHIGNNVYFASKVTVTEEGTNMEFTDVTVIVINGRIERIIYVMNILGMACDFKYTFSEWGNVSVEVPTLDEEAYLAALNPENFYAYSMDVTIYDADYNSTLTCFEFDGDYYTYTLYQNDKVYTSEWETENAGLTYAPYYSILTQTSSYSFVYDANYDGYAHLNPSFFAADLTDFIIKIEDGYLTEIYAVCNDGSEEIYELYDWANMPVVTPTLTEEEYAEIFDVEKFYNYTYSVTSVDKDMNCTMLDYIFDGDSYSVTRYDGENITTNRGVTENAGTVYNSALEILSKFYAEDFVYDKINESFALKTPSDFKDNVIFFSITIDDGYLVSLYIEYDDESFDIFNCYDYGTSIVNENNQGESDKIPTLTQEDYEAILDVDNFYNYTLDSISFDADYNYTMLTYIFDGDSYTVTRYINDNITTSSGVVENAGVVYNFALDILSQLSAEDFVYDEYDEAFALENPSELKSSIVHFFITIEDGYLTSVYIEYDDGSMDTFSLYDYGTSVLESTD